MVLGNKSSCLMLNVEIGGYMDLLGEHMQGVSVAKNWETEVMVSMGCIRLLKQCFNN